MEKNQNLQLIYMYPSSEMKIRIFTILTITGIKKTLLQSDIYEHCVSRTQRSKYPEIN